MASLTCTLNGVRYNNAAGKNTDWSNYSYKTSGSAYIGWAGSTGVDCATVYKITVPSFTGVSSSINLTLNIQNQVDDGGPTTLNWALAKTDAYITGNKYADGTNYPLTGNGEIASGTVSVNIRNASYASHTFTVSTSAITAGGTYYLIMYRNNNTGLSVKYPSSITLTYKYTYTVSYNANGGSSTPASQTKTEGVTLKLAAAISRSNTTATVTTTFNANGGSVSPTSRTSTVTTSYSFASWEATNGTTYAASANYTANAATTMTAQWTSSTSGAAVTLPTPTRTGYTFSGWYTAASGGTKVTSHKPTANSTLYAHWSVNHYSLDIQCGTGATITVTRGGTSLSDGADIAYGDVLTISFGANSQYRLDAHTVNGSTFTSGGTHTVTGNVTVVATAILNAFKLSISQGAGSKVTVKKNGSTLSNGAEIMYGEILIVSFAADDGYKLTSTSHANGSSITVTGDVSVYATADVLSYSIGNGTTMDLYCICIGNGTGYDKYVAYIGNGTTWDLYE